MILVINSGSSSIKLKLFNNINKDIVPILTGTVVNIGLDSEIKIYFNEEKFIFKEVVKNHHEAFDLMFKKLKLKNAIKDLKDIEIVGFRVVHGGRNVSASELTDLVYNDIVKNVDLAPLHNPPALVAIDAIKKIIPDAQIMVSFDTAFHQTIEELEYTYPIPKMWKTKYGIRKYGFHGISCEYITKKFNEITSKKESNLIICHLGNGSSITCVKENKSFDTSMGFTPLSGLMMGTRSGDIDPSIIEYACKKMNMNISEVMEYLNFYSGLSGMSGISENVPKIIKEYLNEDDDSILAIEKFTQIVADYIIKYANIIGLEIDGIIFTGGIGENEPFIREKILSKIKLLNLKLDKKNNESSFSVYKIISDSNSSIPIYVIKTDEEKMIAIEALDVFNENI